MSPVDFESQKRRLAAMSDAVVSLSEAATSQAVAEALALPMGAYLYRLMLDKASGLVKVLTLASDALANGRDASDELAWVEAEVAELMKTRDAISQAGGTDGN